jgi:flagellar hook-length control protein FliK
MPRLRESLADNGMSLAHSEVGQQAHSDQSGAENNSDMHNAHSSQVIVKLDDTEDELPVDIDPAQETAELTNGVSIYA